MAVQNLTSLEGVDFVRGVFIVRWPLGRLYFPVDVVGNMTTARFENLVTAILTHLVPDHLMGKKAHREEMPGWAMTLCTVGHAEEPYVLWKPDVGNAQFDEWVVTGISSA
jgi:hypothetical protein